MQIKDKVVPVEVKAVASKRIKSMQIFMDLHPQSEYGIRFSAENYSIYKTIYNYPLYAVSRPFLDVSENLRDALFALVGD